MRCLWSSTARTAFGNVTRPFSALSDVTYRRPASWPKVTLPELNSHRFTPAFSQLAHATAPIANIDLTSPLPIPESLLTPAQTSRAASRAVHMALRSPVGGLEDAYLIVNSLRYSTFKNDPFAQQSPAIQEFQRVAINLERPISPRLSSHVLLHGLIRLGRKKEASELATKMMKTGLRLRSKTMEAFMHTLVPKTPFLRRKPFSPPHFTPNPPTLARMIPMARDEGTRFALQLFAVARQTHHRRTNGMFGTLLCICLINGEIILASLIFGFVVKDWQLRAALKNHFDTSEPNQVNPSNLVLHRHLKRERLAPTRQMMSKILQPIDDILSTDGHGEDYELSVTAALQALANLAALLDHSQIPFSTVGSLVHSLYNCPRVGDDVWIIGANGGPERVPAYTYFHDVLGRLMIAPPTKEKTTTPLEPASSSQSHHDLFRPPMLPPLDGHSCNALLHYALRHHLSPAHASTVLNYMIQRDRPLKLEVETYNVLLRSGTLLRKDNIVDQALNAFEGSALAPNRGRPNGPTVTASDEPCVSNTIRWLTREDVRLPETAHHIHFLTAHIQHLISTGHPEQVATIVFELFPELLSPISSISSVNKQQKRTRKKMVYRAVAYGPNFFVVLLDALLKAGKTGLAKMLWRLAIRAERQSWKWKHAWVLPVHAYTTMLRCYALEYAKPRLNPRVRPSQEEVRHAKEVTLSHGHKLYVSFKGKSEEAHTFFKAEGKPVTVKAPKPDAMYFNAALELFVPREVRQIWKSKPSPKDVKLQLDRAKYELAERGQMPTGWTPLLQEVGEDIVRAGFPIPPAFRHVFLGRWKEGTWDFEPRLTLTHIPLAYPDRRSTFTPFCIPTVKERGLPLVRRRRRRVRGAPETCGVPKV
ncbi:hypothetical protein Hypma_002053 [Hypsizygus marmoreus]|uniref:Uncharacterized protein n=1 Tax=Hypsizygus marmoreus TaxID=39966 RepID=A0A369J4Y4_HYPMA|nr:hypothetical protein Hypma_002053 [Hypsizygus marmoreus]